jgi:hypothetical protein
VTVTDRALDELVTTWSGIRAMSRGTPPFTSVYLPLDQTAADAAHQRDVGWRHLRDDLVARGAPDDALDAVGDLVLAERHGATVAVVADADGRTLVRPLREPLAHPVAVHGPLPHLGPLVAFAQSEPVYVVVLVDRRGADIVTVVDGVTIAADESVDGDPDAPIRKVAPGGWSQRRYQQRAENTWEDNAAAVADEVAEVARRSGAAVVVAAGDDRARALLDEHLAPDVAPILRTADTGGRAVDGSADELQHQIERIVATEVASGTTAVLRRFVELRERRAVLADGPGATFAALREGLVEQLLVHDDPDDERRAWFDPVTPTSVAMEAQTLRDLGLEPIDAPLVDVAVWAALGTDAAVHLVPGRGPNVPAEGIGAFLRGPVAGPTQG